MNQHGQQQKLVRLHCSYDNIFDKQLKQQFNIDFLSFIRCIECKIVR